MAVQRLSAYYIAELYTLEQIDAKIATLETALTGAASGGYSFDSGQHKQTVSPPADMQSIESLLAVYMKARSIKAGTYEGTRLISGGYTP
jgi:hypothetical protein